ncbi:hypothetical protein M6B22_13355 [Jatrophihabitans cynanchi]|uniref:Type I restriction modification DNA specificity domain-containing protein n=1 Tax=Jatrophihabitans cynanchi TaxID=2944128 RepID=A0ABY7JSI9_9ACTN|nr:hypothetical protein [Jatrophihabitans sp. SB3-54]WAX55527.1 hypothetical protein M6B22_13355 [Jatrophihabitans sp. SB3-54]
MSSRPGWQGIPASIPQVPFRRVMTRLDRPVPADAEIVTAYTDGQVTLRRNRAKIGYHEATDLSGYQGVEVGDFVVHGLDILRGSVGVSESRGAMSSVCTVCRPSPDVDGRYVAYAIRMQAASGYTRALARGIREGGADFRRWDTMAELPVPVPPVADQRRIADFLDDQLSRIDKIIAARRQQLDQLGEYLQAAIDAAFLPGPGGGAPAGRFVRVLSGWAFPSGSYSADPTDIRLLRGTNVGVGLVRWDDVVYWPTDRMTGLAPFRLADGDIVLGMDRPWIGDGLRIARLTAEDLPCLLLQRVAKLTPSSAIRPAFVFWAYRATAFRQQVESELTGLAVPHLSAEQILSYRLPIADIAEQDRLVRGVEEKAGWQRSLKSSIESAIRLAEEFRRSLITAAVTGEFDISSADGSRVPA